MRRAAALAFLTTTAIACGKGVAPPPPPPPDTSRADYQRALGALADDEATALAAFAARSGANFTGDAALLEALHGTSLPRYRAFVDGLAKLHPAGDGPTRVHARLLAAARAELAVLEKLGDALTRGDDAAVAAANQEQRRVGAELDAVVAAWTVGRP